MSNLFFFTAGGKKLNKFYLLYYISQRILLHRGIFFSLYEIRR